MNMLARIASIAVMALIVKGLMSLFSAPPPAEHHAPAPQIETAQAPVADPVAAMADAYKGEIDYAPAYPALDPFRAIGAERRETPFNPADDYWGLPRSDGFETVAAYCSACHSLEIVMQQRQTRDGWDYLLTWMAEKQGMAPPPPETRAEILDYLTREFGGDGP